MNPLQKAAVRRKIAYFAAILVLLTVSIFYRGLEARAADNRQYVWMPFGEDDRPPEASPNGTTRAADQLARLSILSQARRLELRELDQGTPELTEIAGTAVRLLLTGSRGFAVTVLWYDAIDSQKRNDFHKMEQSIKAVTTLQPHFVAPWIFQSWNIAYNVSVEMHSLGDMYFYIARGIELLAEGERRNRKSPDMRYQIAFYYQNKFGVADQVQTLRCLFQLSCIPPGERDPKPGNGLTTADGKIDDAGFRRFCERHPMLVRRLRGGERRDTAKVGGTEGLRNPERENIVQFLRDNWTVPGRYQNATELADPARQFPVLPPLFPEGPEEAHPRMDTRARDDFSGYLAARAWFTYANVLVPPNPTDEEGPVASGVPKDFDPFRYRMPRQPMLILFRQGPPRAQSYQAEMLQKDGWFDAAGWEADAGVDEAGAWFKDAAGHKPAVPVALGTGTAWSLEAWRKAFDLWKGHGEATGLSLTDPRRVRLRQAAGVPSGASDDIGFPPDLTPEQEADPVAVHRHDAAAALHYYHRNRALTNFPFYLASAQGEARVETIQARKTLWKADQARRLGNKLEAIGLYELGLTQWKAVLLKDANFHRPERFDRVEEETAEYELEYVRLIAQDDARVREKALAGYREEAARRATAAAAVVPFAAGLPPPTAIPEATRADAFWAAAETFSPFAGTVPNLPDDPRAGTPWVHAHVREQVLERQGVGRRRPPAGPPPGTQMGPAPPPAPPGGG